MVDAVGRWPLFEVAVSSDLTAIVNKVASKKRIEVKICFHCMNISATHKEVKNIFFLQFFFEKNSANSILTLIHYLNSIKKLGIEIEIKNVKAN